MTPAERDTQRAIDWYEARLIRSRTRLRGGVRYVAQLLVVLVPIAAYMYVTGLIESIR